MSPDPTTPLSLCLCGCGLPVAKAGNLYIEGHRRLRLKSPLRPPQACACGCGGTTKTGNLYIDHHNRRRTRPIIPPQPCACGCGGMTKQDNRFIKGHNGSLYAAFVERVRNQDQIVDPVICDLWTGALMVDGYGHLEINGIFTYAHRAAWEIINAPLKDGECVCHKCDVRNCVRVSHLFVGSIPDNNHDMWEKGRGKIPPPLRGEAAPNTKLTDAKVREIRARIGTVPNVVLAEEYGVRYWVISSIKHRRTWKHIE